MENNEIKALIEKYKLVYRDGKIGTYQTKGLDKTAFMREVGARKAEIIAYFDAQEKAERELIETRRKTFESIPGVAELRKARAQKAEWTREFNRMMETGSSKMRPIDAPTDEELASMESTYPMAVFALEAEYRVRATVNDRLYTIWNETYNALCDGKAPDAVKVDHDARMSQFSLDHLWD